MLRVVDCEAQLSTGCIVWVDRQAHGSDADARFDVDRISVNNYPTRTFSVHIEFDLSAFLRAQHHIGQKAVCKAGLIVCEIDGHASRSRGVAGLGLTELGVLATTARTTRVARQSGYIEFLA